MKKTSLFLAFILGTSSFFVFPSAQIANAVGFSTSSKIIKTTSVHKVTTITCYKGKAAKKVTRVSPKCSIGWTIKKPIAHKPITMPTHVDIPPTNLTILYTCSSLYQTNYQIPNYAFAISTSLRDYCGISQGVSLWHLVAPKTDIKSNFIHLIKVCGIFGANSQSIKNFAVVDANNNCPGGAIFLANYWRIASIPKTPATSTIISSTYKVQINLQTDPQINATSPDSPITYYIIKNITAGTPDSNYFPSIINQIEVDGLNPTTSYSLSITAVNIDGVALNSSKISVMTSALPILPPGVPSAIDGKSYSLNDIGPGGGTVFYYSATAFTEAGSTCNANCHYLEFAPTSWLNDPNRVCAFCSGLPALPWSSDTLDITAANGIKIGSGLSNTQAMLVTDTFSRGDTSGAAFYSYSYKGNDNSLGQWFLPSHDELVALSNSIIFISKVGDIGPRIWSSTDAEVVDNGAHKTGSAYADSQDFGLKTHSDPNASNSTLKSITFAVLPIRAF